MRMTKHVVERMNERGITVDMVREAIAGKELKHNKDAHKRVYHGPKQGKRHVFVIVDVMRQNVVTAYWLG